MYNTLQNTFDDTMTREGITITTFTGNDSFKAFFRRLNDGMNKHDAMTMFYGADSPVSAGTILTINNKQFIALNKETIENTVYMKSTVVRCNGEISTQDADVIGLPFYGEEATSAFPSSGGTTTKYTAFISGQTEIITEDCTLSRTLEINDRFNAWGRTWKIENIFYIDGIVTLSIEVQADTNIEYDYAIEFTDIQSSGYLIGDTLNLDAYATINGHITDVDLTYTSSNTDIATIDDSGNIAIIGSGSVFFSVAWSDHQITVTTTETTIAESEEEETGDVITLTVSTMEDVYMGLYDGECTATIQRNNETVHDIEFTVSVTDCNFANKITVSANQQTGLIKAHVDDSNYNLNNLNNKTFTLLVSVPEYDLTNTQTVTIRSLF